jgi:hypothetical protein
MPEKRNIIDDAVDTSKLAEFVGSAVTMYCESAFGTDFGTYQHRFESALRAYAFHRLDHNDREARPLLDEVIAILDEVKRRGVAARSATC